MTKLKYHILIDCISFTCVMVLFSIIGAFLKWEIPTLGILVFFLITTLISLLMYFTNQLPIHKGVFMVLIDLADIALVVFVVGGAIFRLFTFDLVTCAAIAGMILVVYFAVIAVITIRTQVEAKSINQKIQERRKRKEEEKK